MLQSELVGYGPGHAAALFDTYWNDAASADDTVILPAGSAYSIQESTITFESVNGFPGYPGDAMTFRLWRYATDINDTCADNLSIRSLSVIYQGQTTYLPLVQN